MLLFERKVGDTIVIGDRIRITVVKIKTNLDKDKDSVSVSIDAPRNVPIVRTELFYANRLRDSEEQSDQRHQQ